MPEAAFCPSGYEFSKQLHAMTQFVKERDELKTLRVPDLMAVVVFYRGENNADRARPSIFLVNSSSGPNAMQDD
jgi:hypothetical protein